MYKSENRTIKLIGIGLDGKKFVNSFENNINKPKEVEINSIFINENTINYLKKIINKTNPLNMDGCGETRIYNNTNNEIVENIKKVFQNSLKITFVVNASKENDIEILNALILVAKVFYVVFDVILLAPGRKEKETKAEDNFEICKINLKRNLIKFYVVELDTDYNSRTDVTNKLNNNLLAEAFTIAIHAY